MITPELKPQTTDQEKTIITTRASCPIGVFDSGLGGLTIVKEIIKRMPCEDIVYLGDTARLPYGSKSEEAIKKISLENILYLHSNNVKMVVIACNTASAISLEYLRNFLKIPIVGVVECGAIGGVKATKRKRIGVIGTKATVITRAYTKAIRKIDPEIEVFEAATPLLVHLVEDDWVNKDVTKIILKEYLAPLLDRDIDTLILGCTHYPFLAHRIQEITNGIAIVDSSAETSHLVFTALSERGLATEKKTQAAVNVYLSEPHANFQSWANSLLGFNVEVTMMGGPAGQAAA